MVIASPLPSGALAEVFAIGLKGPMMHLRRFANGVLGTVSFRARRRRLDPIPSKATGGRDATASRHPDDFTLTDLGVKLSQLTRDYRT
jgi:hypothetical protein